MKLPNLVWITFVGMLVGGCSRQTAPKPSGMQQPPIPVRTVTVVPRDYAAFEEVVGTVRPRLSAVIAAKVSGTIEKFLVAPGQSVAAGALLVQLDAREIQARVDQARAVLDQATKDKQRLEDLLAQKVVTQSEYDAALSRFRVAQGSLTEGETMLKYTRIEAPFAAVVARKTADVGDLAMPGKPLLVLEDSSQLRLEADVPETVAGRLSLGDKLQVRVAQLTNLIPAVVSELSPSADPLTRTFLVKLAMPPMPGVRSGQFGRVAVPIATVPGLRVPESAVIQRGQMEMVFVMTNQLAVMRLVKSGKRTAQDIEIVSGLAGGENVIVEGIGALRDGQPVTLKP